MLPNNALKLRSPPCKKLVNFSERQILRRWVGRRTRSEVGIDGVGFFRLWLPLSSRRRPASHRFAQGALKTNTAKKKADASSPLQNLVVQYTFFPGIGRQATTYFLPHSSSFFLRKSGESLCAALSDPSFFKRKVGLLPLLGKVSVATQMADKRELEKERKGCVCPIASLHCYTYLTYYRPVGGKSPWTEKDKKGPSSRY